MARKRKDGKRAYCIYSKKGNLYIAIYEESTTNGGKSKKVKWHKTGLKDDPENVLKAIEIRDSILNSKNPATISKDISISALSDHFLNKKQRDVAETTLYAYKNRCAVIKKYFGETKAADITPEQIERFLDDLFIVQKNKPRTVKDIRCQIHSLYDLMVKQGVLRSNPVDEACISKKLKKEYAKKVDESETFFDYEEVIHFLGIVEDHPLYELFYFTIFFGLRREEVLGLRWSCINRRTKELTINHTVAKADKIVRLDSTKTDAGERTYPLEEDQIRILDHLWDTEQKNRALFGDCYNDNDYIFKHSDGSLYYIDYPSKQFTKILKKHLELPQHTTFHGLRKSCVSLLVHRGFEIKEIQKWVGHKDYETTAKIYALIKEKESKKNISKDMSNIIKPKSYK